jgi:accessory gene regulator B
MIERTAALLAMKIRAANPSETSSVDVLKYGIAMSLNLLGVIIGSCVIGFITGKVIETLMAFGAFAVLRRFSGGFHAKSLGLCVILSVALFAAIPMVPVNGLAQSTLKAVTLLLIVLLAPANCQENGIPERYVMRFKVIAILLAIGNLFVDSTIIALAFFVQAVLLIDLKRVKGVILR